MYIFKRSKYWIFEKRISSILTISMNDFVHKKSILFKTILLFERLVGAHIDFFFSKKPLFIWFAWLSNSYVRRFHFWAIRIVPIYSVV